MLVVLYHASQMIHERFGRGEVLTFGSAGVDLFFPISGFVMVLTTHRHWGQAGRAGRFLLRRLVRVVPMYWAATLLKIAGLLALPAMASHPQLDAWHVAASFLFIPAWDVHHRAQPVVPIGWTLNFEMMFYALFALALGLRVRPVWWVATGLAVFSFLPLEGLLGAVGTLANPILLEFVAGMFIGWAAVNGRLLPRAIAAPCLTAAFLALPLTMFVPAAEAYAWRWLLWGIPGALALAAAVALEPTLGQGLRGWPEKLGDASYAIYLVHGFVLPPLGILMGWLHLNSGVWPLATLLPACGASAAAGWCVHRWLERPLTDFLNDRMRPRELQPASAERGGPTGA
jgi:peptidoglycan/LPS O-acetylase OafA/YrhL